MSPNENLVNMFERIADLLEITGADRFRVNTYRKVARTLDDLSEKVDDLAQRGELASLPGVGKSTVARITQYIETGTIDVLNELQDELPEGLPDLLAIQGMGPKKVAAVYRELGVGSLKDLERAIESGQLEELSGFGKASVKKISDGIDFLKTSDERTAAGMARLVAESLEQWLTDRPDVKQVDVAGSLRRGRDTVGDIDILCESTNAEEVIKAFTELDDVRRVLAAGKTKGSVIIGLPIRKEIQVDLRAVPAESFGAAMQYFTGSKEHNVKLREMAVKKGWRLNEYGLFDDNEKQIAGADEEEIYNKLGFPWFPPEIREDRGEFDHPEIVDELVSIDDIRGDLHMHTTASDGVNTITEMAEAAKKKGYEYIAITDHTASSTIANGLSIDRMWQHIEDIRDADKKVKNITILVGCELDILSDGTLDYTEEIHKECDFIVASIHSALTGGKTPPTYRTLAAMESPYVNAIGHPSGRLIGQRPEMELDYEAIIKKAAETGTALEINSSMDRLDLRDIYVRKAIDAGVNLIVSTDSHFTGGLDTIIDGLTVARRGWAKAQNILNAQPISVVKTFVGAKRRQ